MALTHKQLAKNMLHQLWNYFHAHIQSPMVRRDIDETMDQLDKLLNTFKD